MGYPIIFETRIIKLSDGRLLHLDLSGCNNDDVGRRRDEFTGTIYTNEEFEKKIRGLKEGSKPYKESDGFELKVLGRYSTFYDYALHLERMRKKAETWEELISSGRHVVVKYLNAVDLYTNGSYKPKRLTPDEWQQVITELMYKHEKLVYRMLWVELKTEKEVISALEDKKSVRFTVGRKNKSKKR